MAEAKFHAVTLVDPASPVPAQWLQKAGIDCVYTGGVIDLETGPDGQPELPEAQVRAWEKLQQEYEGTGMRVLIMTNYYSHNPRGTDAVDVNGREIQMACLYQDKFYEWMAGTIVAQAKAYSRFDVFGGFCFDDGWGIRVDCCYCDTCRALFRDRYGLEAPPFDIHEGTAVVADDDPLLLWEQFQREAYDRYMQVQSEAVRSVSDDLLMLTIPSDSYFYGRLLNANMTQQELPPNASALIQRIERLQVKHWFLYQSFPLARLPEADESGLQPWAIGCHVIANSPKLIVTTEGPFLQHYTRTQMMSPEEIEQMARITVTEGADAICYWQSGSLTAYYPEGYDGMAAARADMDKLEDILAQRQPYQAQVGLLYSTTTEVMEQPWQTNLNERWVHLHSFEATAFALMRGNIPFRIVMEDEVADGALEGLRVLIIPSARFLSQSAYHGIEQAASAGMVTYLCGQCAQVSTARSVDYDVTYWHRRIQSGYRQIRYLDTHYADAEKELLPLVRGRTQNPVTVSSRTGISKLYHVGDRFVVMVANWALDTPTNAELSVTQTRQVTDILSGESLGAVPPGVPITVKVPPAGWRVLELQ